MKVLIAFTDNDTHNPFVKELKIGLEEAGCEVTWSLAEFWKKEGDFDVVHIQWPEYLFLDWWNLNESKLFSLKDTLTYWKKKSKIIITRHNEKPHYGGGIDGSEALYDIVYECCDGVVHLGPYLLEEFKKEYPGIIYQTIIPHHVYTHSYPNVISRENARKRLHLNRDSSVILVFGKIRHEEERVFLKDIFRQTKNNEFVYLVPRWLPADKGSGITGHLRSFYYKLKMLRLNLSRNIRISDGFLKDEEVQIYFNAADIVFIPRLNTLNSGIVTLSYFFRKVVVGPSDGNIGIDLRTFGDPVYSEKDWTSLAGKIDEGLHLAKAGKGEENYKQVIASRTPGKIGEMHVSFYKECISAPLTNKFSV